jgi:DNA polymerase theta
MNNENGVQSVECFRGAFMVMQLHDEVIYEVCKQDLIEVQAIVKDCMENCMDLPVKMKIKMKTGTSWGSLTNVV